MMEEKRQTEVGEAKWSKTSCWVRIAYAFGTRKSKEEKRGKAKFKIFQTHIYVIRNKFL